HALFLLTDKPEVYGLPPTESAVLPSRNNARGYLGALVTAVLGVVGAVFAFRERGGEGERHDRALRLAAAGGVVHRLVLLPGRDRRRCLRARRDPAFDGRRARRARGPAGVPGVSADPRALPDLAHARPRAAAPLLAHDDRQPHLRPQLQVLVADVR